MVTTEIILQFHLLLWWINENHSQASLHFSTGCCGFKRENLRYESHCFYSWEQRTHFSPSSRTGENFISSYTKINSFNLIFLMFSFARIFSTCLFSLYYNKNYHSTTSLNLLLAVENAISYSSSENFIIDENVRIFSSKLNAKFFISASPLVVYLYEKERGINARLWIINRARYCIRRAIKTIRLWNFIWNEISFPMKKIKIFSKLNGREKTLA